MESAEAMIVFNKYDELMELVKKYVIGKKFNSHTYLILCSFEDKTYTEWTEGVDVIAKTNLERPLLVRDSNTELLSVNFNPQLVALLREVKYLEMQKEANRVIPEKAAAVFEQNETYRKYLQNLDVTVHLYNGVRETILDVEYPLIEGQLNDIDVQLDRAISELNWTSEGKVSNILIIVSISTDVML